MPLQVYVQTVVVCDIFMLDTLVTGACVQTDGADGGG